MFDVDVEEAPWQNFCPDSNRSQLGSPNRRFITTCLSSEKPSTLKVASKDRALRSSRSNHSDQGFVNGSTRL